MSDILQEAEELLIRLPEAVTRRKFGERLGQAVNELQKADAQIARMKALLETADLIGYGKLPEERQVIDEMITWARTVGVSLENAEDGDSLRRAVSDYTHDLVNAIVGLDRALRAHWRKEVVDKFQPLIELGTLLSEMNVPNNLGKRLVACGREAQASINAGLATDLHHRIKQLLADHRTLQDERANEISGDEVGAFIKAIADNRATLAMVTPKVYAWLKDHNALGSLGVTTRQRGNVGATSD
jgi:hypothetical protein